MMGARNFQGLLTSLIALTATHAAHAQTAAPDAQTNAPAQKGNAASRSLAFTVPLVYSNQVFGDVLVEVAPANDVAIETATLRRQMADVLNDTGKAALDAVIAGRPFIKPAEFSAAGFAMEFDSQLLQLSLISILPEFRPTRQIGRDIDSSRGVALPTVAPAGFSTYLNITTNYDYDTRSNSSSPDFFFSGATRAGGVVLEYEGALTDQFGGDYSFYRRSTRAVYDAPDSYRRYTAGDLRLNSMSILRTPQIGGIAVEKSRQIFDPFYSVTRLGGRQIFLDNRSDVDVLINGEKFDSFQLDAGNYDLASLPIQQGSNDVQLLIRDSFGKQQVIDYNFFFEPLSLPAGEKEYSLGFGFVTESLGFEPSYSKKIAVSGYYRKAISENLIVGGALQGSKDTQVAGATLSVVPQIIPGVFDMEIAGSRSDAGNGLALRADYRLQTGNGLDGSSQFAVNVDYQSRQFSTIDQLLPIGFDLLSVSATYSKSFTDRTYATLGGNYSKRTARARDDYTVFADVNHRVSDRMRVTAGAEYGLATAFRKALGVRVGLTLALGARTRAGVDYRSRTGSMRANFTRGADNEIGSVGYDVSLSKFRDDTQADLQMDYISNRFEARANVTSSGQRLGDVFDDQRMRLQVGTSVAFAGGSFGIGRPIDNSFMLARPHAALETHGIITARTLSGGSYYARSGALGAAVQGDLTPYNKQSVQFDAANPGDGFDVGDGVVLVEPPYKSGYKVVIGSEHFVSVIGVIETENGPVGLATGRITALDENEDYPGGPFYTNARGRYGVFGLAPGKSYLVTLSGSAQTFVIDIPADGGAIVRKPTIIIPAE